LQGGHRRPARFPCGTCDFGISTPHGCIEERF
jgi:hypothetical protein